MADILNTIAGGIIGAMVTLFVPSIKRYVWGPEFKLEFHNDERFIVPTPLRIDQPQSSIHNGFYVRIRVTNIKPNLAKNCRAFLVNIEQEDNCGNFISTAYCESMQLQWTCRPNQGFNAIDLPNGIPQFVDVFSTIEISPYYEPKIELQIYKHEELFHSNGTFRFTIQVSGDDVTPKFISLIVMWRGIWNNFEVSLDKVYPSKYEPFINYKNKIFNLIKCKLIRGS